MALHKPHPNNNHNSHTTNFADYESDAQYYDASNPQAQPAPPPLRSNEELNLAVLRRHNTSIISILSLANYAVVYIFSPTTRQWEKTGIEGSLFVCTLAPGALGEDRYTAFVLNRRGLTNFDLPLTDSENVELTEEYVILKEDEDSAQSQNGIAEIAQQNGSGSSLRIYGIWIYSEPPPNSTADMRTINAQLIRECAAHAGQSLKLAKERFEAAQQNGLHAAALAAQMQVIPPLEELYRSQPMGREPSLKDLFGQQRAQDDEWSIRAHHESQQLERSPPEPPQPQTDVLRNLFQRAGLT
ncbi:hypothetical protein N7495_000963 [Penicillium taxi]|uniref:uncharacterized protein n=1 Tax=Penicillium taxi TaxID=168475 RepID=UPI002545BDBC|nr:uncharacterized protein N7495_000963 [Penicillium taxi]KAJ5908281.1 hypothetical protein N7495_000963 [Penicillium taxi]